MPRRLEGERHPEVLIFMSAPEVFLVGRSQQHPHQNLNQKETAGQVLFSCRCQPVSGYLFS